MNIDGIWRFIDLLQRNRILILELDFTKQHIFFFGYLVPRNQTWQRKVPKSWLSHSSTSFGDPALPMPAQTRAPLEGQTKSFERRPKASSDHFLSGVWMACSALIFKFAWFTWALSKTTSSLRISLGGEPTQSVCGLALPQSIVGIPMNQPTMAHIRHLTRSATEFGPNLHPISMEHIGY